MPDHEHFANAPITEAVIDIRVDNSDDVTIKNLGEITKHLPSEYTDIKNQNHVYTEFKIQVGDEPNVAQSDTSTTKHTGFICSSEDGLNIAQIRLDGFTFSELAPYTNWSSFSSKAEEIWNAYCTGTSCKNISRLAVRYVNHMELPLETAMRFDKYLTAPPVVPKPLPQSVGSFLTRVLLDCDNHISANVTQAMLPPTREATLNILLDIDVFKENLEGLSLTEILPLLNSLRKIKNNIFYNYITDEAKGLFR